MPWHVEDGEAQGGDVVGRRLTGLECSHRRGQALEREAMPRTSE
jgi:hypothetical protein